MSGRDRRQERFLARYGPWAVVTGASSGIGREIARRRDVLERLASDIGAHREGEIRVVAAAQPIRKPL